MLSKPLTTLMIHQTVLLVYRVVTGKNKASGRGFCTFLVHSHLGYNRAKKTQYGKDGVIIVRVVKVTLLASQCEYISV